MIFQTFLKLFVTFLKTALWQGIHLTTIVKLPQTTNEEIYFPDLFDFCRADILIWGEIRIVNA